MEFTKKDLNKTLWVKQDVLNKTRKWYKIDAEGKTLGKLAVEIANKLVGKSKPFYTEFWDCGDYVIIENSGKIKVSGNKLSQKIYYSYSGHKGNVKSIQLQDLLLKKPEKAIWHAVRGMLPKNKLRDKRMKRLKLFVNNTTKYSNLNIQSI